MPISQSTGNVYLFGTLQTEHWLQKICRFLPFSNPMPGSEPITLRNPNTDHLYFYHITNDGIRIEKDINRDRMEFWNDIFNENKHLLNTDFDFRTATRNNLFSDLLQIIRESGTKILSQVFHFLSMQF